MDSTRLFAAMACALALNASQVLAAKDSKLPDVIGKPGPDAVKAVNTAGYSIVALIPVAENTLAAESNPGRVFKQDPAAAAKVDTATEVRDLHSRVGVHGALVEVRLVLQGSRCATSVSLASPWRREVSE